MKSLIGGFWRHVDQVGRVDSSTNKQGFKGGSSRGASPGCWFCDDERRPSLGGAIVEKKTRRNGSERRRRQAEEDEEAREVEGVYGVGERKKR